MAKLRSVVPWRNSSPLLVFACLFLCLFNPTSSYASPENVRIQLKWYHQFQFAGYYAAQLKGFYQEEGLDAELIEGAKDRSPDKIVLEGKAEFGVHDGGDLLYRRLKGDPLIALATIFQHSPYIIASKKQDGIRHPADLVGRTVLITQDQGSASILAMFRREGIKVTSTFDKEPVRFAPHSWDFEDVLAGRADAMSAYITEVPRIARQYGVVPAVLNPLDYGVDFYGDTLFASEAYLTAKPDVVARFRRASIKGWQYAMAHPHEIADFILALPSLRQLKPDRQTLLDEAESMKNIVLPTLVEMGNMNPGRWEAMAKVYQDFGMVSSLSPMGGFIYEIDAEKQKIRKYLQIVGTVLAGITLLLLFGSFWLSQLRKQVSSRTRQLTNEITERKQAEQALQDNFEVLNSVLTTARDGFWRVDSRGNLLAVNPTYSLQSGYKREELVGMRVSDLEVLDNSTDVALRIERIIKEGGDLFESKHRRKDGSIWDVEVSASYHAPKGGEFFVFLRDITERKQAENKLHDLSQRLLLATSTAKLGVWDWSIQENSMVWDDRMFELYGITRDESPNTFDVWTNGLHPEDKETAIAECQAALKGEKEFDTAFRVRHPDGTVKYLKANGLVLRGTDGKAERMLGVNADITVGKIAEAKLRQNEEKTSRIIENASDAIFIADQQGRYQYVNKEATRLLGYSQDQLLSMSIVEITPPEELSDIELQFKTLLEGKPVRSEIGLRSKGGTIKPVEISATLLPDGNVYGSCRDITARKAAEAELEQHRYHLEELVSLRTRELAEAKEAAEAANLAKSTFLANMSHEIRTPLNGIIGMTHLLRRGGVTPVQADRLAKIETSSEHLLNTINDILDLSKIEAGKIALEETLVDINALLNNVKSILMARAQAKGLKLHVVTDTSWPDVQGDPTRLQQALINYVGNAIKFTETGSITLRTLKQQESADSVMIRFEVQDTGVGIAADVVPRLFTAFSQADSSTTRKYGGTGLGLAITQRLAELMGGEAGVESAAGVGSTFWFSARLHKYAGQSMPVRPQFSEAEHALKDRHTGRQILIVDDESVNLEVARLMLEDIGLRVDTAQDGIEAVQQVSKTDYAAILMDMQMPNLDGLGATRQIRNMPNRQSTPILAITANAFVEDRTRCYEAGMNDFIAKPFIPDVLYATLLKWLEQPAERISVDPSLKIGIPAIDQEHLDLIHQLDRLIGNPDIYPGAEKHNEVLRQLGEQLTSHFANEEHLIQSIGMPEAAVASHVKAHSHILEQYNRLNPDLMQGRGTDRSEVLRMIKTWVIDHIVNHDLKIRAYVRKPSAASPDEHR